MTSAKGKQIPERKRERITGKGRLPPFIGIPKRAIHSQAFAELPAHTTKLLLDLAQQYNGANNGDLSAAWSDMRKRGWHSPGTLHKAKQHALETGFAIVTRQGGRNTCSLYALTWWPIDECKGKHDEKPTHAPLFLWEKRNG